MKQSCHRRTALFLCGCVWIVANGHFARAGATARPQQGLASWYGEEHCGKLMANGHMFDPDQMTAASWFYPLGTRVRVTVNSPNFEPRSVTVTITDRGPAKRFVQDGRVIDLARAAFRKIAHPQLGLIGVVVEPAP